MGSVRYACVRRTAKNRPREQNPDALQTLAQVKTDSVRYACVRRTAKNRPREQNPDALQTLAEVKTDSVRQFCVFRRNQPAERVRRKLHLRADFARADADGVK